MEIYRDFERKNTLTEFYIEIQTLLNINFKRKSAMFVQETFVFIKNNVEPILMLIFN